MFLGEGGKFNGGDNKADNNLLCYSFSRSINVISKLSWMQNSCEGGKDLKRAHNPVG